MMRRELIGETLLNQFRIENFIASGGMATIYRVWDIQRSVPLAMKVLHPELAADPSFIARFQREAQSLQMLVHPHIVPFYGIFQADELTFLLERYIDGPSLDEILRKQAGRPMPLRDALVYFKALYTSLGYAHNQGIVHCDVKPGNVLVDQGGHVYLTDFGIARYMDASVTTSSAMGTPLYMAPEQIRGDRVSPQSDIYSLGVLMFELLTGQRPFRGDLNVPEGVGPNPSDRIRYQHLSLPAPDPRTLNPSVPLGVAEVVMRAMEKDPARRFGSVSAMADALSAAVAARFDTLPDRVSLPSSGAAYPVYDEALPGPDAYPEYPAAESPAADYPAAPVWDDAPMPHDTYPARPFPTAGPPAAAANARPAPARPRRWMWLLGLLVLAVLCLIAGAQLARGLRLGQPGLPAVPEPTETRALPTQNSLGTPAVVPEPTQTSETEPTPEPTVAPSPTASGLSSFDVQGSIVVPRYVDGTPRLFVVDAATGAFDPLPGVPNVDQRDANAPQFSPDGQRLVWIGHYNGKPHVVAMDMDNRVPYQLPAGETYNRVSSPAFLPDGGRVSFWAANDGPNQLVIADAVSGEEVETIPLTGYRNMFVWNWAGGSLAYIYAAPGSYQVGISGEPAGSTRPVDTGGEGYAPAWSNDGQWITFQSDAGRDSGMNEIWVARSDGSQARAVTSTPPQFWSRAPTWSPDGSYIAFVSDRSGSRGADYGELFVVQLATGEIRQITDTGGTVYDWRPAWRP